MYTSYDAPIHFHRVRGCFTLLAMMTLIISTLLLLAMVTGHVFSPLPPSSVPTPPPVHHRTHRAGSIVGPPSLSAARINQILAQSPARGLGETLYTLSQQYQIDDAVALAFFHHESAFGTQGVARVTRSIGNIIWTPGCGYARLGRFRSYTSWAAGATDWYRLMAREYIGRGWTLLTQIIPVYAPASDQNDVAAYIRAIQTDMRQWG